MTAAKRKPEKVRRHLLDHLSDREIIYWCAKEVNDRVQQKWSPAIQCDLARRLRRIIKDYAI